MTRDEILTRYSPAWLGSIFECHDTIGSTNDRARDLLEALGPGAHGAVVLTDSQSAGRGRLGRTWVTPPGKALALSVALWPNPSADGLPLLTLAGALAARAALASACGLDARLKWPNDVLVAGKKIAGVLLEGRWIGENPGGLVLGVGVNLLQSAEDFPPDLRETATSALMAAGTAVDVESFAAALLSELEPLLALGLANPHGLVEQASPLWTHESGDALEVVWEGGRRTGHYAGVGSDGALLLESGGRLLRMNYGEVRKLRSPP